MEVDSLVSDLAEKGYFVHEVENIDEIIKSRSYFADFFRHHFGSVGSDNHILNNIHSDIEELDDAKANAIVLDLIKYFRSEYSMADLVYRSSSSVINSIFGMDIACQRNPNIVFQYPGSMRFSELHTDSPNNSPFEIVYWLPLVDCYQSKSFYLLNYEDTLHYYARYSSGEFSDWSSFKESVLERAIHLNIKFGQVLGFWSGLLHGSLINETEESRFSYNMRFKNLYAPHGMKDPLVFYDVLKYSPLTKFATK